MSLERWYSRLGKRSVARDFFMAGALDGHILVSHSSGNLPLYETWACRSVWINGTRYQRQALLDAYNRLHSSLGEEKLLNIVPCWRCFDFISQLEDSLK